MSYRVQEKGADYNKYLSLLPFPPSITGSLCPPQKTEALRIVASFTCLLVIQTINLLQTLQLPGPKVPFESAIPANDKAFHARRIFM